MLCLTVRQPWASLIARGLKTEEYRGWCPSYRGPLAIHAGRALPDFADGAEVRRLLTAAGLTPTGLSDSLIAQWAGLLKRGFVVAVAQLVAVRRLPADHPGRRWGAFAWQLQQVEELARPMWAVGARGLWEVQL
jgi:hypothetical protein